MNLARYRKFIAALLGVIAMVVASGALHGSALVVCNVVLAGATAAGVVALPNSPTTTTNTTKSVVDKPAA